ncbi:MAG: YdcF family protein [Firmicutes bacterium]|nr:YdcF family protein [Bacillota bacterium]
MGRVILCMLGAFSLTYGFVVKAVNSGTKFYMVWMGIGILCLLWALLIQLKWWKKIPGWIRGLFIVLVILCAGATACGMGLIFTEFDAEGPEGLDYVVVLGAQVRADGPSVILKYRLDAAADYLKKNPGTVCIVTGGQGYNEPYPEAVGMKDYLVQQGIEEERILTEETSTSTVENIVNASALMDPGYESVGIITNNFHVYRGTALAEKQGMKGVCGIAAGSKPLYLPNNLLREVLGIGKDTLMGKMNIEFRH